MIWVEMSPNSLCVPLSLELRRDTRVLATVTPSEWVWPPRKEEGLGCILSHAPVLTDCWARSLTSVLIWKSWSRWPKYCLPALASIAPELDSHNDARILQEFRVWPCLLADWISCLVLRKPWWSHKATVLSALLSLASLTPTRGGLLSNCHLPSLHFSASLCPLPWVLLLSEWCLPWNTFFMTY